ncbi:MAG: PilZ domain-containing protein [Myxococcales bacterium]|nr:PilZ domain-containing protein [Myxococcales bacterium]
MTADGAKKGLAESDEPGGATDPSDARGARRRSSGTRRAERSHTRTDITLAVAFEAVEGGAAIEGCARNISLGGAYIDTMYPSSFGSKVKLKLPLPGIAGETTIDATVRWCSEGGMGVQFGPMGAVVTHALMRLMADGGAQDP